MFCCWRYEERNGKQTKVPYNPRRGERAKSNDPQAFTDYQTASRVSHQYDGIGLGIMDGICTIDLDYCIDADGNYSQTAAEIIAMMHSYTELSPSGTGVHILFQAEGFRYNAERLFIMNRQRGIEVYVAGATNKYVTITGQTCAAYEFGDRSNELHQMICRSYGWHKQPV